MLPSNFWLGDEASLSTVIDAHTNFLADPAKFIAMSRKMMEDDYEESDEEEEYDRCEACIQVEEGVGILTIDGSLVAKESPWDQWFGMSSYPMLSRACLKLAEMYQAGEIHSIVHAFSSSGGDAEGINGFATAIKLAKRLAPNTISWTGTRAFSAAYWAAVSNKSFVMESMAESGSIGVISVARSMSRYFKEMGIDNEVFRSGAKKALVTPFEPISEAGAAEIQKKGDTLHQFFVQHVMECRPSLKERNVKEWGTGATFFGDESVALGLADESGVSLSDLVGRLQSDHNKRQQAADRSTFQPTGGTQMAKKQVVFTDPADRERAMAGVPIDQLPHTEVEVEDPPVDETPAPAAADPATLVPIVSTPSAADSGQLAALFKEANAQVAALTGQVATLTAQLAEANTKAALAAEVEPLLVDSIHRLQVAAGWRPAPMAGLPLSTLADQYRIAKAEVDQRFPTGRRSVAAQDEKTEDETDPGLARLKSISPKDSTLSASRL
jgi:ClpP class serine protease